MPNHCLHFLNTSNVIITHQYHFLFQCCALAFIEKLDADALNMTEEEFGRCMTGETVPHDPCSTWYRRNACEGINDLKENLKRVGEVKERVELLMANVMNLQSEMDEFSEDFSKEIDAVRERTPLKFKMSKEAVAIDDEALGGAEFDLPSPLTPQVLPVEMKKENS